MGEGRREKQEKTHWTSLEVSTVPTCYSKDLIIKGEEENIYLALL